jgi:hypothetical protein
MPYRSAETEVSQQVLWTCLPSGGRGSIRFLEAGRHGATTITIDTLSLSTYVAVSDFFSNEGFVSKTHPDRVADTPLLRV